MIQRSFLLFVPLSRLNIIIKRRSVKSEKRQTKKKNNDTLENRVCNKRLNCKKENDNVVSDTERKQGIS
ncbi:hypothetical protein SporoP37_07645 [Sporosarcina sp. P37]|nr:hypothetical protein SporoP37_07645 [Sporosarcina sp. P37]PID19702.1 hypothetical protein CSV62_00185 [Sporosarcina sp. P35]